jgi:hypothetical protein
MLIPAYTGQNNSYSYEPQRGEYFLHDNNYTSHIFLTGKDASLFRKQIEYYDNLPPPDCNNGLLVENLIKQFL